MEHSDVRWKAGIPASLERQLHRVGEQDVRVREDHEEADQDREDGEKDDREEEDQNGVSLRKRHSNYFGGGHPSPHAEKEKGREASHVPGGTWLSQGINDVVSTVLWRKQEEIVQGTQEQNKEKTSRSC
ncbi:hypothetical protein NDU88_007613 [Pleurodeles waltl]|uniref:Uncharacterized protein n=1 Tax=Pleurodeles waltl TaxID=8319 RepID=A0AAV7QNJ4_PLEWA|nr:hypothetical protein NDU88_007613 [Pleurodeles waltl]